MSKTSSEKKLPVGREHVLCDECSRPGPPMTCSRCHAAFYCNKACQKKDWKSWHKQHCTEIGVVKKIQAFGKTNAELLSSLQASQPAPSNTSCFICLTETMVDPFTLPDCGHTFCFKCLQKWQSISPDHNCPACRIDTHDIVDSAWLKASLHWCRAKDKDLDKDEQRRHYQFALDEIEQIDPNQVIHFHQFYKNLFKKAQLLLDLEEPEKALKICEEIERNVREGDEAYFDLFYYELFERKKQALKEGRFDVAAFFDRQIQEQMERCSHKPSAGRQIFQLFILMAKCKEALEDYRGATDIYLKKLQQVMSVFWFENEHDKNINISRGPEQFQLKYGLCMCLYKTKLYDLAIENGEEAISLNRCFPYVHKYVALSHRDNGNLDAAIRTMGSAVTYEAPWDREPFRAVNLQLYNELKELKSGHKQRGDN
mmetsp:Transcript_9810/g.24432  ORF Transcript_9810/g.24432 Transcript_9810/m.24432 type:complete len:427 (+) Transcript_9810:122-1402(+)